MIITLWILLAVSILASNYIHGKFLDRLKLNHSDLFKTFGKPTKWTRYPFSPLFIIGENTQLKNYTTFMANKSWLDLDDAVLNSYAKQRKILKYLQIFLLISWFYFVLNR